MTNPVLQQGFPQISVPIVDPETGNLSISWYQFFRALWARTGSAAGASSGVSEVDTGTGLTGGPINSGNPIGTISLENISTNDVLGNITGHSAPPIGVPFNNMIDHVFGSAQGDILYRDTAQWAALPAGIGGQFLKTQGGAQNPVWSSVSGADLDSIGSTQGDILYRGVSTWQALGPGTSGFFLKTQGSGADPVWASAAGGTPAGLLLNIQVFASHGTSTYTPTAGTNSVVVWLLGAGGGGGGATTTAASHVSIGGSGAGGAFALGYFTSGFSGQNVVIGQGGAGGSGAANGGNGGNSTFINSGHLQASGGAGGAGGNDVSTFPSWDTNTPAQGGTPGGSGLQFSGTQGIAADAAIYLNATQAMTARAGGSIFGDGGAQAFTTTGTAGSAGQAAGSGGTGAANTGNQAGTHAGGAGADGLAVIFEYS